MGKSNKFLARIAQFDAATRERLSNLATNAYMGKVGIGSGVTVANVTKASKELEKIIKSKAKPLVQIQVDVNNGMLGETQKLKDSGMSEEEVFNFYWNIPEFRSCWQALQWDEYNLRAIIGGLDKA